MLQLCYVLLKLSNRLYVLVAYCNLHTYTTPSICKTCFCIVFNICIIYNNFVQVVIGGGRSPELLCIK